MPSWYTQQRNTHLNGWIITMLLCTLPRGHDLTVCASPTPLTACERCRLTSDFFWIDVARFPGRARLPFEASPAQQVDQPWEWRGAAAAHLFYNAYIVRDTMRSSGVCAVYTLTIYDNAALDFWMCLFRAFVGDSAVVELIGKSPGAYVPACIDIKSGFPRARNRNFMWASLKGLFAFYWFVGNFISHRIHARPLW